MKQINQRRGRGKIETREEQKERVNETMVKVLLGAKYLADDGKLF